MSVVKGEQLCERRGSCFVSFKIEAAGPADPVLGGRDSVRLVEGELAVKTYQSDFHNHRHQKLKKMRISLRWFVRSNST